MANGTFFYPNAFQGGPQARARVPNAQWYNGVNPGAGKNIGIGINIGGGKLPDVTGANSVGMNWTLLDQGLQDTVPPRARVPQGACPLGCSADVVRVGNTTTTWDVSQPSYTPAGAASSGGLPPVFAYFGSIGVGSNPNNVGGFPVEGAAPIDIGEATLATLIDGWENVVAIEP